MTLFDRLTQYAAEAEAEQSLWSCARAADVRAAAEVVAAVEALGAARRREVAEGPMTHGHPGLAEKRITALRVVNTLADRLHARRVYEHMTAPGDGPVVSGGVDDTEGGGRG